MPLEDVGHLLDRIGDIRHPCDLDLLVFLARHPCTLMSSEQLAVFLGYEVQRLAASLDTLLAAGLVARTPNVTHAARMFVFQPGGSSPEWLPALLAEASTRSGRLALIRELKRRSAAAGAPSESPGTALRPKAAWPRPTPAGNVSSPKRPRGVR